MFRKVFLHTILDKSAEVDKKVWKTQCRCEKKILGNTENSCTKSNLILICFMQPGPESVGSSASGMSPGTADSGKMKLIIPEMLLFRFLLRMLKISPKRKYNSPGTESSKLNFFLEVGWVVVLVVAGEVVVLAGL